jgi:hypothetical protein
VGGSTRHLDVVHDNDHLSLLENAGSGHNVPWSFESDVTAIDSTFNENGAARLDRDGFRDGVSVTSATRVLFIGTRACDERSSALRSQKRGIRPYAEALILALGSPSCSR